MPVIDLEQGDLSAPFPAQPDAIITPGKVDVDHGSDAPVERPAWSQTVSAAFRKDNTVGSFFVDETRNAPDYAEPGFNAWDAIKGTKYEARFKSFYDVRNARHLDLVKQKLDREDEDRKLLDAAPWYQSMTSQMLAGVADIPTLIPGGAFIRGANGGYVIGRSALSMGMMAGVGAAAQEGALQAMQETRTGAESAFTIGGAVILGGLLGSAGARLLTPAEWSAGVKLLDDAAALPPSAGAPGAASAGAAAASPASLDANAIAGRAAGLVAGATSGLNPALRILHSPSAAVREIGTGLFENSLYLKKNFEGVASEAAVETLAKEWNGGLADAIRASESLFDEFKKSGGALKPQEFREAVGRAMRRGDEDADPFVAKAAKEWRAKVFDPLKKAAIDAGLLPPDVTVETAESYFSRMWNRNKLVSREGEFKQVVQDWAESSLPGWADAFDKAHARKIDPLLTEIRDLEQSKLMRAEEARLRDLGEEVSVDDEASIRAAMRIVQGGAPKPKGVVTLTQFLQSNGGLVDSGGELRNMGITNKTRPGFVRQTRRSFSDPKGGMGLDDAAHAAWEAGYFPHLTERPSIDDLLSALEDDFFKRRAVVRTEDRAAMRLSEVVSQIEDDLARIGVRPAQGVRFATSEETKGMVARVQAAPDAQADERIAALRKRVEELDYANRMERETRFIGDPKEFGRQIADEVFNTLTGKVGDGVRPEFLTVKARGPLAERTFNIPDRLVEDFLEHDVDLVARRYSRVMGADVEIARKFGRVDLQDQINAIREDYAKLRNGITDEKQLRNLDAREKADIRDVSALRDMLRGTYQQSPVERSFDKIARGANHLNYLRSMGEVVLASLTDAVRPAMVHGLGQYMTGLGQVATNLKAVRLSVREAQQAGNVLEKTLAHRLATLAEVTDPYASRGPVEAFLENMTNVASKWNGIRQWTDMMKSVASVMTQDRILRGVENFARVKQSERAYLAFLGIDQSMAERIAKQFSAHGENLDGVRVAHTAQWTDPQAVRAYRAAMNKDVDSIIVQKSVADVPLFASTPTGRMLLQFKSFALASHQKVLLRGLQEDQARFVGGLVAMTLMGMAITWLKAISGNRPEQHEKMLSNPGWWIGEGLDRSGVFSVPMELANMAEKASGLNPVKSPLKAFDAEGAISQKNQNRSLIGSLLGPTAGLVDDTGTVLGIPNALLRGDDVTKGQKSAAERLLPFNSYLGLRQMLRYVVNPPEGR